MLSMGTSCYITLHQCIIENLPLFSPFTFILQNLYEVITTTDSKICCNWFPTLRPWQNEPSGLKDPLTWIPGMEFITFYMNLIYLWLLALGFNNDFICWKVYGGFYPQSKHSRLIQWPLFDGLVRFSRGQMQGCIKTSKIWRFHSHDTMGFPWQVDWLSSRHEVELNSHFVEKCW